jgi:cell pole-organizing protein PopZ
MANNHESVDKILENIKRAIENKAQNVSSEEDVLELTEVIHEDLNKMTDSEVKALFKEVLKPYLQSWLAHNLHSIAREVIEKEVKTLIAKHEAVS